MNLVVDTSVIIAVILNEAHKKRLVEITKGTNLLAPSSLHWEIGNAFSAMFKRRRITLKQAIAALTAYGQIPLRFCDVGLTAALKLSESLNIYAYDAYVLDCALNNNCPIVSLDAVLLEAARETGIEVLEVTS
jgi:predicted nucleic acid-binding protein